MSNKSPAFPLSPVESSNVAAIGYDAPTSRFGVRFKSGAEYHYAGVGPQVAEAVTSAKSVGSAVNSFLVKGDFSHTRIDKEG